MKPFLSLSLRIIYTLRPSCHTQGPLVTHSSALARGWSGSPRGTNTLYVGAAAHGFPSVLVTGPLLLRGTAFRGHVPSLCQSQHGQPGV